MSSMPARSKQKRSFVCPTLIVFNFLDLQPPDHDHYPLLEFLPYQLNRHPSYRPLHGSFFLVVQLRIPSVYLSLIPQPVEDVSIEDYAIETDQAQRLLETQIKKT